MAHGITSKLRGMLAAFVAVIATLALVPGMAFADPAVLSGGSLKVIGVSENDNVEIYKIVDTKVDADSNQITYTWADGIDDDTFGMTIEEYLKYADGTSDEKAELGDKIAQVIIEGELSATQSKTVTERDEFNQFAVQFDDLTSGQYLVRVNNQDDPTRVYPATIQSVNPEATDAGWVMSSDPVSVRLKSNKVTITKEIQYGKKAGESTDLPSVGDEVTFRIYVSVPKYRNTEGRTYTVVDTMSDGFKFVKMKTIYDSTSSMLPDYGNYEVDDEANTITFTFTPKFLENYGGKKITISYTAKVTGDASWENALTNQACVTFSKYNWGTETQTQCDTVYATVYGAKFKKVTSENKALEGAVFDVYKAGGDTPIITGVTSDADGFITVDGLGAGDYILRETSAPAGYKLAADKEFTIDSNVQDGYRGVQVDFTEDPIVDEVVDLASELPTTGGMGTVAFTAAGVVIMAGAAAFIVRSRKNNN